MRFCLLQHTRMQPSKPPPPLRSPPPRPPPPIERMQFHSRDPETASKKEQGYKNFRDKKESKNSFSTTELLAAAALQPTTNIPPSCAPSPSQHSPFGMLHPSPRTTPVRAFPPYIRCCFWVSVFDSQFLGNLFLVVFCLFLGLVFFLQVRRATQHPPASSCFFGRRGVRRHPRVASHIHSTTRAGRAHGANEPRLRKSTTF